MSPKLLNILLILIPVTLYLGFLDPMYTGDPGLVWTPEKSIPALKAANVQYTNALSQVDIVDSEAKRVSKDYGAIDKDLINKVNILLPDTIDPLKLRNEVAIIANKSAVSINSLTVVPDLNLANPALGSYKVFFSVKTKYPAFKELMQNYEKNMRLFTVESVTIRRPKEKEVLDETISKIDSQEMLSISVTFKVNYLK